jgi:hypothetical protein
MQVSTKVVLMMEVFALDMVAVVVVLVQPDMDATRFPDMADARFLVATFESSLQTLTIGFKFHQGLRGIKLLCLPRTLSPALPYLARDVVGPGRRGRLWQWQCSSRGRCPLATASNRARRLLRFRAACRHDLWLHIQQVLARCTFGDQSLSTVTLPGGL